MSQTLLERAHCIRWQAMLNLYFWAEAINMAAFLIKQSPSTAQKFKYPNDVKSQHPIDYSYPKILMPIYVHI